MQQANITHSRETLIMYFTVAQACVLGGIPQIKHIRYQIFTIYTFQQTKELVSIGCGNQTGWDEQWFSLSGLCRRLQAETMGGGILKGWKLVC